MALSSPLELGALPVVHEGWWGSHVVYRKFSRQVGMDIVTASFVHRDATPKANIIFVTGIFETFLKYSELIKSLFEEGYNVFTYDHQSQGLSGRWLAETQSVWVNKFEDYIDDFLHLALLINKEYAKIPINFIGHSMGGFIGACSMAKMPTLINRAVLVAPMIRMKCGLKLFNYKNPLHYSLAHKLAAFHVAIGMGKTNALGNFIEKPEAVAPPCVLTSSKGEMDLWAALRTKLPHVLTSCPTYQWILLSMEMQALFSLRYDCVMTNTLIIAAEHDFLVYNSAMQAFSQKAKACEMAIAPGAYHEVLLEKQSVKVAAVQTIKNFFGQKEGSVKEVRKYTCIRTVCDLSIHSLIHIFFIQVELVSPIVKCTDKMLAVSMQDRVVTSLGLVACSVGIAYGVSVLMKGRF